jgi:hypothetical protein
MLPNGIRLSAGLLAQVGGSRLRVFSQPLGEPKRFVEPVRGIPQEMGSVPRKGRGIEAGAPFEEFQDRGRFVIEAAKKLPKVPVGERLNPPWLEAPRRQVSPVFQLRDVCTEYVGVVNPRLQAGDHGQGFGHKIFVIDLDTMGTAMMEKEP